MLLTEGQVNDHRGAAILLPALPDAEALIAEEGYDSDSFRPALASRGIEACIPGRANRREPLAYDTDALPATKPQRAQVRSAERLAAHRHSLRQNEESTI